MKFDYRKYGSGEETIEHPAFKLHLVNPLNQKLFADYVVLVDSGATNCIFHAVVGEAIGIDVKSGSRVLYRGVSKEIMQYFAHKVTLIIGTHSFETEVGFSYDHDFPFGLLGQVGFFEKFRVCFDKSKSEFEITPK
ncbi:MAG: hypothetical protein AAB599_00485 [Patescibacteria group bacterium]